MSDARPTGDDLVAQLADARARIAALERGMELVEHLRTLEAAPQEEVDAVLALARVETERADLRARLARTIVALRLAIVTGRRVYRLGAEWYATAVNAYASLREEGYQLGVARKEIAWLKEQLARETGLPYAMALSAERDRYKRALGEVMKVIDAHFSGTQSVAFDDARAMLAGQGRDQP